MRTKVHLKILQALPLELKIPMTQRRIRDWIKEYGESGVYLAFSGGKDSTVLKHIIDSMGYDIPAVFSNTGLEYPEIQRFVMDIKAGKHPCFNSNVVIVRPEMRFDEVIKKYGYPVVSKIVSNAVRGARENIKKGKYSYRLCKLGVHESEYGGLEVPEGKDFHKVLEKSKYRTENWRFLISAPFQISEQCCDVMKKAPMHRYEEQSGRVSFIATMAQESLIREAAWLKTGCNAFSARTPKSTPLSFWTEQDILHYIKQFNVPYCPTYGEIVLDDRYADIPCQINIIDYTNTYEATDKLKTTGEGRTGCMFCMFGCHLEKEPNRFQRAKITHSAQYKYAMGGGEFVNGMWQPTKEGLGCGYVLDCLGVSYK